MPWSETTPMRERVKLVAAFCDGIFSMTELAQLHGISRKTGYKWVERVEQEGLEGLKERSRAPKSSPHRTPEQVVGGVLEMRRWHPRWGPKKLIAWLEDHRSERAWPAASTAGEILKRHGLVRVRPFRRRVEHPGRTLYPVLQPNDLWTADFKGQFRTGDARYCYPLTAADCLSRYLLGCQALRSSATQKSQEIFERLFQEYGLPLAIRTDNGAPFASIAVGRLSTLSVWWIRLGILPVLIEPSHPEQNASHERMHRTLKEETARPPQANLAAQQRRFDRFRREYNEQRPPRVSGSKASRILLPLFATSVPQAATAAGVPRPLRNPASRFQRMHQLERPVASSDPGSRGSGRWPGGNRSRHLVDSFRSDAARTFPPGRGETARSPRVRRRGTGLLLSAKEKSPKCVTHVPGLNCHLSPRPYKGFALVASISGFPLRTGSAKDLLIRPGQ